MISPASGIRRPSYNGAPAMLGHSRLSKIESYNLCALLLSAFLRLLPVNLFEKFNYQTLQRARARVPAPLENA